MTDRKDAVDSEETNVSMMEMFKFVFSKVLKKRGILVVNVVVLIFITGLQFVLPQITQNIIDKVIPQGNMQYLLESIGVLMLSAVLLGVLNYFSTYYMSIMSQGAIYELRTDLYDYILGLDTHFFESSKTGDLMVRLTNDISNLQSLISANMLSMVGGMFTFVGVYIFIFIVNWQMALAVTITFPLMFLIYRIFRSRIHNAFRKARLSQAQMSNQMQNTLTEISLIKSYTSEQIEEDRFAGLADKNRNNLIQAAQNQAMFSPLISFVNYLGTAIVLLLGSYFVINKDLMVGQMVAYITYVGMLQDPIRSFAMLLNQLQQSLVSYGRITEILKLEPAIKQSQNAVEFPELKKGVKIDNVSFSYDETHKESVHDATLHGVSFDIEYGKMTALVGHSGSGKTTITKLIDRLYDIQSGDILFDDVPIKKLNIQSLRKNISIVSQDIFMVDGTIKDNIVYGKPNATDDQVWQVAKLANIDEFIKTLPNGMDTQIGERGIKLSGGQKQRVSIARALLKDAQIVIMDEATASLDNESEKAIQHAMSTLLQERTSLVIAHRLSTIHNADKIVVLDDGKVVEQGTHDELIKKNGDYAKLYNAQFE
ncbi:multidrug ABC transporter ATP-binding protein [Lentilactobacillus curieae]|uniref:Multidrug resistance ABC transporter ATP-binding and permease protein n=1 Tax=Lentilactobacillus curieae TaxID=1138822 RepID=A0A1S6QKX6_9LACO|nr:ABC transporter ATP-binding protein [Lentilactobacillus curieae]AQW22256.1 multidrug ABC transporter ATP-binding protein [Lentilactobacillus curieae]